MKMLEQWIPDSNFGAPLACLATSFTFDSDFFTDECLSRFLAITLRDPDGAVGLDIAGMLEEEERLAEARVCVLVDQSCRPQPRNLRWDLLAVRVPGGLLHAKVAVLIWQNAARVIIGSANLTNAGYRSQVELATALDLDANCRVPRSVFSDLSAELRSLVGLAVGDSARPGPCRRALDILDMFDARIAEVAPPENPPAGLKIALAAGRAGVNPLDRLADVWSGTPPQAVTALSPFWDDRPEMPGARAVLGKLAERASKGERTRATFVVPVDTTTAATIVRAPANLRDIADRRIESHVVAFRAPDERRLHAKCVQYQSANWVATMFGSSNLTAKGLGLDAAPHRELNLWIGCRASSPQATSVTGMIPLGDELDHTLLWESAADDEEDPGLAPLPMGFGEALLVGPSLLELSLVGRGFPPGWRVEMIIPGAQPLVLLDSQQWDQLGRPEHPQVPLPSDLEQLPSLLEVHWRKSDEPMVAIWLVNVGDSSLLPPPAELRQLPVDVLLAILASTRPLRAAVDDAQRRHAHQHHSPDDELDPLKRFDSSGFLLQRTRRSSEALWGIERRLSQPIHSPEALEWRLAGTLGPEHIAAKLVEASKGPAMLAGEAHFLLAELALTIHRIPWSALCQGEMLHVVESRVRRTLDAVRSAAVELDATQLPQPINEYLTAAFAEAQR